LYVISIEFKNKSQAKRTCGTDLIEKSILDFWKALTIEGYRDVDL
jgi:hypothetical protein